MDFFFLLPKYLPILMQMKFKGQSVRATMKLMVRSAFMFWLPLSHPLEFNVKFLFHSLPSLTGRNHETHKTKYPQRSPGRPLRKKYHSSNNPQHSVWELPSPLACITHTDHRGRPARPPRVFSPHLIHYLVFCGSA